jgi:hypothetical protein
VKRLLPAAVVLTILLVGCSSGGRGSQAASPTATPSPVALTQFVNPAYPYAVGYPAGWKAVTSNPDAVRFQGANGRQITVDAQAVPELQPPMTLPAYADQQVEVLRKAMPDLIELQRSRVGLPNKQSGVQVDVMWGPANAPRRALLLYVLDSGVGYTLRADAPTATFPSERHELEAALRSFTLTPPD